MRSVIIPWLVSHVTVKYQSVGSIYLKEYQLYKSIRASNIASKTSTSN